MGRNWRFLAIVIQFRLNNSRAALPYASPSPNLLVRRRSFGDGETTAGLVGPSFSNGEVNASGSTDPSTVPIAVHDLFHEYTAVEFSIRDVVATQHPFETPQPCN